ncbi:MAG: hypothetical protein NVSMB18_21890 [Acetobacteraceae bacterium]
MRARLAGVFLTLMTPLAAVAARPPATIGTPYNPMGSSYTCAHGGLSRVALAGSCCQGRLRCSQFLSTDVLIRGSRTKRI